MTEGPVTSFLRDETSGQFNDSSNGQILAAMPNASTVGVFRFDAVKPVPTPICQLKCSLRCAAYRILQPIHEWNLRGETPQEDET